MLFSNLFYTTITRPTRLPKISFKKPTLIDHLYTNSFNPKVESGVCLYDISDHLPIFTLIPFSKVLNQKKFKKRDYKNFKPDVFTAELSEKLNKYSIENSDVQNPDDLYENFHCAFKKVIDKHAPLKMVTNREFKKSLKPWITSGLYKSIRKKQSMYKNHYLEGSVKKKEYYKKYSNLVSKLNSAAKKQYFHSKFESLKQNIKGTWGVINNIIKRKSFFNNSITLKIDNQYVQDPKKVADHFGKFFQNIGPSLADKIPATENSFNDYLPDPVQSRFKMDDTNEIEIYETILSLKDKKSTGFDNLPTKIIKISASIISPILSHIFNKSFSTGIFPEGLKIGKIIPIFKSGDKNDVNNYRPISILTILAKVMEKLVYKRLMNYLNKNNILYNYQFGFRENHSTQLALFELIDHVSKVLDNGGYAAGLFLDLSKAFDTVNHDILLSKLENYGIRDTALNWFASYLRNRKQSVEIENISSDLYNVHCGVPQGSNLGPILFLLYINDMPNCSKQLLFRLFADDTAVILKHDNLDTLIEQLNLEIVKVHTWLKANKLSLNILKTKLVIFHPHRKKILRNVDISIDTHKIERVESIKYLGIYIDEHLNWKNRFQLFSLNYPKLWEY